MKLEQERPKKGKPEKDWKDADRVWTDEQWEDLWLDEGIQPKDPLGIAVGWGERWS